jgi:hypothetical protein
MLDNHELAKAREMMRHGYHDPDDPVFCLFLFKLKIKDYPDPDDPVLITFCFMIPFFIF